MTRTEKAKKFFDVLWPDDVTGKLCIWTLPDKKSKFFDSTQAAASYTGKCNGSDVYFGVGSGIKDLGEKRRGDISNIRAFPALVADLDIAGDGHKGSKKELFESMKKAQEFLESLPLKPTMTVFSGGGLHSYWRLTEPFEIESDESRAEIMTLSKGWAGFLSQAAAAKGYSLDAVHDITRVLRVPGSSNHKTSTSVPVEIISCDEKCDYSGYDFEPYLVAGKVEQGLKQETVSLGKIILNPNARPNFDKFEALCCNIPEFKRSWERTRKDMKDTSASAYDLALANIAAKAGWTPQETADLLVASRIKHGDPLKIRDTYYGKTIEKAFAPVQTEKKTSAGLDAILATIKKPSGWTRQGWNDDERNNAIAGLQKALALPILEIAKYGKSIYATYKVTFEGDIIHNFLSVEEFESQKIWHNIAAAIFLADPLHSSKNTWNKIVKIMRQLVVEYDAKEYSPQAMTADWILNFCGEDPCTANEATDADMPFVHVGNLYIRLGPFMRHLRDAKLAPVGLSPQRAGSLLADIGFSLKVTKKPVAGAKITRYWIVEYRKMLTLND